MGNIMYAVIYARYSSHHQRDASIEDQIRVCRAEAKRRGDRIIHIYADRARSGRNASKRPEFLQMIADAPGAKWKTVYIYKTDRFARNRQDAIKYKMELQLAGVSVVSAMEPMSDGPESILLDSLLEGLAEYYSANLSQNIKRGMEGNALKCKHNGVAIYGYDLGDDGYYKINESERPYVVMAYEMAASGKDTGEIAEALASQRTRGGRRFNRKNVLSLLRNEKYKGIYKFNGHRVEGGMAAIVDAELWDAANSGPTKGHAPSAGYALSGKLYDGKGNRFAGSCARGRNGSYYYYYRVPSTGESYPVDLVEDNVSKVIAQFLAKSERVRNAIIDGVLQVQAEAMSSETAKANALRERIHELDREADNLVGAMAKTGATDRMARHLGEVEAMREEAAAELADLESTSPRLTREVLENVMSAIIRNDAPIRVVKAFVHRVVINGNQLLVEINVRDDINDMGNSSGGHTKTGTAEGAGSYGGFLVELTDQRTKHGAIFVAPWGFVFIHKFYTNKNRRKKPLDS